MILLPRLSSHRIINYGKALLKSLGSDIFCARAEYRGSIQHSTIVDLDSFPQPTVTYAGLTSKKERPAGIARETAFRPVRAYLVMRGVQYTPPPTQHKQRESHPPPIRGCLRSWPDRIQRMPDILQYRDHRRVTAPVNQSD